MADKLGLGSEVRQLKLGSTFSNPRSNAFHSVRYDFKPASVDQNKKATVDVGNNNQVTVTVPHLDGAGIPQTLFKGSQKPYQKECVLIIDRVTGEITLEKLTSNIQVKKTRAETYKPSSDTYKAPAEPYKAPAEPYKASEPYKAPVEPYKAPSEPYKAPPEPYKAPAEPYKPPAPIPHTTNRPITPVDHPLPPIIPPPIREVPPPPSGNPRDQPTPITQRTSSKTKVASGRRNNPVGLIPKHSPLHASPSHHPSPSHNVNRITERHNEPVNHSMLASLPMIGLEDIGDAPAPAPAPAPIVPKLPSPPSPLIHLEEEPNGVGILSDSSSSSSSDSASSDSESEPETSRPKNNGTNVPSRPATNGKSPSLSVPDHLLTEDLCLSESATDSD